MDVVGAGDVNIDDMNVLRAAVQGSGAEDVHDVEPMTTNDVAGSIDSPEQSTCVECGFVDPPNNLSRNRKVLWIQCDECSYWYHKCCVPNLRKGKCSKYFKCCRC